VSDIAHSTLEIVEWKPQLDFINAHFTKKSIELQPLEVVLVSQDHLRVIPGEYRLLLTSQEDML